MRLLLRCTAGFARSPRSFDAALTLQDCLAETARRTGSEDFILNCGPKQFLVITGRELSAHILAQPPNELGYMEGPTKTRAMSFLAPQGLTITHGAQWRRLRLHNEAALRTGEEEATRLQLVLDAVEDAFAAPPSGIADLRSCMAETMRRVVFGTEGAPAHLVEDMRELFRYVQSPGRRALMGWSQAGRRRRFYEALRRFWAEAPPGGPSLIATAKGAAHGAGHSNEELIQQVPHWMFTFTGSGADLLARTLGMLASRNDVYDRVEVEALAGGAPLTPRGVANVAYLESCLLETCRLFPPVTRTFHVAPRGDVFQGRHIPAGMEILHCFTAGQRDPLRDATANDFRPERWMEPWGDAAAAYPGLFLGGARSCPGEGLILFVCKAAIATLMQHGRIRSRSAALSRDPLPHSFPKSGLRFTVEQG